MKSISLSIGSLFRSGVAFAAFVFVCLSAEVAMAQEKVQSAVSYDQVGHKPEFPGGQKAFYKFLGENLKFPEAALKAKADGKVVVSFVIDETGKVSDIQVVNKVHPALAKETERVLAASPKWIPGRMNDGPVAVTYKLPITFSGGK